MCRVVVVIGVIAALVLVGGEELFGAQKAPSCRVKGDPLIFGAASFFVPGLGQFMTGQDGKGLFHLVVAVALTTTAVTRFLTAMLPYPWDILVPSGFYLGWAVLSAMDAYEVASTYCKA